MNKTLEQVNNTLASDRALKIAQFYIDNGFSLTAVAKQFGHIGSKGGNDRNISERMSGIGRTIMRNKLVLQALQDILPKEGKETREYVRKKLYQHAESEQNPHISLKATEILAKTEAMLTENVNIKGEHKMAEFIIDLSDTPNPTNTQK